MVLEIMYAIFHKYDNICVCSERLRDFFSEASISNNELASVFVVFLATEDDAVDARFQKSIQFKYFLCVFVIN